MSATDDSAMESLARSFLLGTARNPVPLAAALVDLSVPGASPSELTALALLGQRMRFRRHGPPPAGTAAVAIDDRRAIVPHAARALMRRLVGGKDASSEIAAVVVADTCHRRRLRPHPFDVPRLAAFVKAHGDLLGPYAVAWAARGEETETQPAGYFDADGIDETNWTAAQPAARAEFIALLRTRTPDHARALVEASFSTEPAPVRARLLGALACGLSAADVPFLETLAKDRAQSVREEAQRLLKFIPGTAESEGRLRDLVARTKVSTAGLIRRRKVLTLEPPANLRTSPLVPGLDPDGRWAANEFAGLGLDAMAAAFALSVPQMIAAAGDDAGLTALFARQASLERRFDLLAGIVREHSACAWIDALGTGDVVELRDDALVDQWCEAALVPASWPALPPAVELVKLYRFLRRPLPETIARALLRSPAFASFGDETQPGAMIDGWSLAIAALVPAPARAELRTALAALPPEDVTRALLLLDCLTLLDPP